MLALPPDSTLLPRAFVAFVAVEQAWSSREQAGQFLLLVDVCVCGSVSACVRMPGRAPSARRAREHVPRRAGRERRRTRNRRNPLLGARVRAARAARWCSGVGVRVKMRMSRAVNKPSHGLPPGAMGPCGVCARIPSIYSHSILYCACASCSAIKALLTLYGVDLRVRGGL